MDIVKGGATPQFAVLGVPASVHMMMRRMAWVQKSVPFLTDERSKRCSAGVAWVARFNRLNVDSQSTSTCRSFFRTFGTR